MPARLGDLYMNVEGVSRDAKKLLHMYVHEGVAIGWGACHWGELGTTNLYNFVTPFMIGGHDKPFRMACCGESSTWLGIRNVVMTMGSGSWGELGVGDPRIHPRVSLRNKQRPICAGQIDLDPFTHDDVLVDVAAGFAYVACVSLKGRVYSWGANNYAQCSSDMSKNPCGVPVPWRIPGEVIVQVACSNYTVLARTASGSVYGRGVTFLLGSESDLRSQLAKGQELVPAKGAPDWMVLPDATKILYFEGKHIVQVRGGPWHFAAVAYDGRVYTWGLGNNGRLGHGDANDEVAPRVVEGLSGKKVIDVACGSFHTVFVTADGEAYACGDNQCGQCGLVGEYAITIPIKLKVVGNRAVLGASCGRLHTLLLLERGEVVAYGSGIGLGVGTGYGMRMVRCQPVMENYTNLWITSGPAHNFSVSLPKSAYMLVIGVPHRDVTPHVNETKLREGIISCAVGAGFTIMINRRGSCYSFGMGGWGQLGFDTAQVTNFTSERVPVATQATRIHYFSRTIVTHVAAGFSFAMAIIEGERVYSWGNNSYSQCGLGVDPRKVELIPEPREITWLADKEIIQVACGCYFALALSSAGDVYSWGALSCCGHGSNISKTVVPEHLLVHNIAKDTEPTSVIISPTHIHALKGIISIAAGGWHALALNAIGEIYAWGVGGGGRLGQGNSASCSVPTRISCASFFTSIRCGCYNSCAIDDDGKLYVWGANEKNQLGMEGKVYTPTVAMSNVRDVCLGKYFTLVLTYDNTFHLAGVLEQSDGIYRSTSFLDTHNLPPALQVSRLQMNGYRGLRLFGGLEHVIVLVEKAPTPRKVVAETVNALRNIPELVISQNTKTQ